MIESKLIDVFKALYTSEPLLIEAPGRINLIGEHTDYNDGFVLPAAIDKKATFAIGSNNSKEYRFYAIDLDKHFTSKTVEPAPAEFHWANYLLGVLAQFQKKGINISGIDCVFRSTIPIGAGLSSSAAIECGFASGLNQIFDSKFTDYEIVKIAQNAEHEYAGVMCGIMDQFASVFGKKDCVFQLDCRSHEFSYYPFEMNDHQIALVDTNVKHKLASSEYNRRREECEEGVAALKKYYPGIKSLRDISNHEIDLYSEEIDPVIYRRCHYVISENKRVMDACDALEQSDFFMFGEYMYLSHEGLKNDYEVSCKELDLLVDITKKMEYVLGSRMMGGGFGGCTINLIKNGYEDIFRNTITESYKKETGITPSIYMVKLGDGVKIIDN